LSVLYGALASLPVVYYLKRPGWDRLYDFEFAAFAEFAESPVPTIASATVTVAVSPLTGTAVTVGMPSISGTRVQVEVSGGVAGQFDTLDCTVTLSTGKVLSMQGGLSVVA
jgi:hypothetical protein